MELLLFGPFRLDRAAGKLTRCGSDGVDEPIALRPKAFDVLRYLVEQVGRTISLDEFLCELWPGLSVQPEVLKGHIFAIRAALGDQTSPAQYIQTVRTRGYRFIAEIQTSRASVATAIRTDIAVSLVGRNTALAELEIALNRAHQGDPQIVFLSGEPGIGKTVLSQTFTRAAEAAGAIAVMGNCLPGSGETDAYHGILELLGALSRGPLRNALSGLLDRLAPTWLVQLPALASRHPAALNKVIDATPHRMAREFCDTLAALTQRTLLLLVLEDIHWADSATLDLLQVLAHRRTQARLMVIATLRTSVSTEAGYTAATLAQKLSLYRVARDIKLQPLRFGDIETFLSRLAHGTPPEALVRHLHARSEGNPLFMQAMLDFLAHRNIVSWGADGWRLQTELDSPDMHVPPDLAQIIETEIRELPAEAQSILEVASLSDGSFSAAVHHVAAGMEEQTFETICTTLARRGQMIQRGEIISTPNGSLTQTYTFRHALFQQIAHDRQGIGCRAQRHAAIAERLEAIFAADPARVASSLAKHWCEARQHERAIHFLRVTARIARQRFALREAAVLLEQAIALCSRLPEQDVRNTELGLLEEVASIYLGAFDRRAEAAYRRLQQLASECHRVDAEARALVGLGYLASWTDADRSLKLMGEALEKSTQIQEPFQRARLRCSAHGWRNWIRGGSEVDTAGYAAALRELRSSEDRLTRAAGDIDHVLILFPAARYLEAIEAIKRGFAVLVEHALEANVDFGLTLWMMRLGTPWALMSAGRFGDALDGFSAGIAACDANGEMLRSATLRLYQAFVHERMHDHATALAILEDTTARLRDRGLQFSPKESEIERVIRGLAQLGIGRHTCAYESLSAAHSQMEESNTLTSWYWRLAAEWGMTDIQLANGNLNAADAWARRFLASATATEERSWRALAREACARVALARRAICTSQSYLTQAWQEIEGYDAALVRWRLHSVEALVQEALGDAHGAERHRCSQAEELSRLASSLPAHHAGRDSLKAARLVYPDLPAREFAISA